MSDTQLGPGARILAGARGRTCGPQALLRSANRAIGLGRACGHGRTAEAALPAHTLERAMAVALVPREDNAFANDNPPPARNAVLARYRRWTPARRIWIDKGAINTGA